MSFPADQNTLVETPDEYDDCFVHIDGATATLTLKRYLAHQPTRKVHIPSLFYIRSAKKAVSRIGIRRQGISLSGVLWACDEERGDVVTGPRSGYGQSFVIKAQGDRLRRGFSVEDPAKFLAVLKGMYPGFARTTYPKEANIRPMRGSMDMGTIGEDFGAQLRSRD